MNVRSRFSRGCEASRALGQEQTGGVVGKALRCLSVASRKFPGTAGLDSNRSGGETGSWFGEARADSLEVLFSASHRNFQELACRCEKNLGGNKGGTSCGLAKVQ